VNYLDHYYLLGDDVFPTKKIKLGKKRTEKRWTGQWTLKWTEIKSNLFCDDSKKVN
jgi:hypothetical protein